MLRSCANSLIKTAENPVFKSYKYNKHKSSYNPQVVRRFHASTQLNARVFKDAENLYAYSILQGMPIIKTENLFPIFDNSDQPVTSPEAFNQLLDQNWRSKSATEIVECFKNVLDYSIQNEITLADHRFDKLVDGLMDQVLNLTDCELSELLSCVSRYPMCDSYADHNFHDIWSALDDVCCWKMSQWSTETMYLFADLWYHLNLGKLSDYMFLFIEKMQPRLKFCDKTELIHLLFYIKVNQRYELDFEIQNVIDKYINDMTLSEMALTAMAFLRRRTKFKLTTTPLAMVNKLKNEFMNCDNEICVLRIIEVRRFSKYMVKFLEKLATKTQHLTKSQLILAFFYINICRKLTVDINFETALEKHMYNLTANEMAVIAMGFFKSQSMIKIKFLLDRMIKQTKLEIQTIHEISLTAILKVLRYSSHVLLIDQLLDLLNHITPEIDRFSNICCIHIALLGTTLQFFHEDSLKRVCQKLIKDITDPQKVRLKDMERLLLVLTMYNYDPKTEPDIFDAIYKELHKESRQQEFVVHPRCLQSTLHFLSLRKLYSYELMDRILDEQFILEVYGKSARSLAHNIFSLDVCIEVECPDYKGNRLDKTHRLKAAKWHAEYTPSWDQYKRLHASDKFYLNVLDITAKIVGGHGNVRTHHVLPNFVKADIIVCKDAKGNFVSPDGLDCYSFGDVMRVPDENLKWYAIMPLNWNNTIRNTSKPLGSTHMKYRQLQTIGYTPIMVIWNDFKDLNDKKKLDFIIKKLI